MADEKSGDGWRQLLLVIGIVAVLCAVALELALLFNDYTKDVVTNADTHTVTTTTHGSAPAPGLVTGVFGIGVACVLVAALWNRISKISVAGVDIDVNPVVAAKVAAATTEMTRADPEKWQEVFADAWAELRARGLGVLYSSYGPGPTAVLRSRPQVRRHVIDKDIQGADQPTVGSDIDALVMQAVRSSAERAGL